MGSEDDSPRGLGLFVIQTVPSDALSICLLSRVPLSKEENLTASLVLKGDSFSPMVHRREERHAASLEAGMRRHHLTIGYTSVPQHVKHNTNQIP